MPPMSNMERMLELAEAVFYNRDGADGQITVDEQEREKLQAISPHCLTEYNDGNGPAIWVLLIPTTQQLMQQFVAGTIDEVTLLNQTPLNIPYEALYLCSAITLPEYRGKGLTMKLTIDAIKAINMQHQLQALFYWPFSEEGKKLAERISINTGLSLHTRVA